MNVLDDGFVTFLPFGPTAFVPGKPLAALLVEDVERFVTELGEFRAPSGTTFYSSVVQNLADNVDLLSMVDLMPNALEDFSEHRTVGIAPIHQTGQYSMLTSPAFNSS